MTPCREWVGAKTRQGYGTRWWKGRSQLAHRVAWEETNGPIPDGLFVCHHCDNPPCINPDHLFLGTAADNAHDRDAKGRNKPNPWSSAAAREASAKANKIRSARMLARTHCRNGHPLSGDNLAIHAEGYRVCRTCNREAMRRSRAKRAS